MASTLESVLSWQCRRLLSRCTTARIRIRTNAAVSYSTLSQDLSGPTKEDISTSSKDPLPIFLDKRIQTILQKITGFDLLKIFKPRRAPMEKPKYKLLTEDQLEKEQKEAEIKGRMRLQMPPVMKMVQEQTVVISDDIQLDKLNTSKLVFTDISMDIPHRKRFVVVRETSGKLRHVSVSERARLLQTYFPVEGRQILSPRMFEEELLEKLLKKGSFEYILDRACIQFEPDYTEYIRVTQRTYEYIRVTNAFNTLRSTRHFGPMTFYYVWYNKVDKLLVEMIQRELVSDAANVVRLYNMVHPGSACAAKSVAVDDDVELLKIFSCTDSTEKHFLELALQTYEEGLNVCQQQQGTGAS